MSKIYQETLQFHTKVRGTSNITRDIADIAARSGISTGLCHVFVQHTSASVILCENADPTVRSDLETFMAKTVPDGSPMFRHTDEGPDDMSAHVRSILTNMDLTIPVSNGQLALGTWQGIYLWEHRTHSQHRRVIATVTGE
jgi:secondary thiamine-phosphate synthase enzyme